MTDHPLPPTEPVRCRATKGDGTPCGVSWGLSPAGLCFLHDPDRKVTADAARAAGAGAVNAARRAGKYRTLDPQQLGGRPARTRREIEQNIATMAFAGATGTVDPNTLREFVKACVAHLKLIDSRTVAKDVRALKRQVKALKRGRSA